MNSALEEVAAAIDGMEFERARRILSTREAFGGDDLQNKFYGALVSFTEYLCTRDSACLTGAVVLAREVIEREPRHLECHALLAQSYAALGYLGDGQGLRLAWHHYEIARGLAVDQGFEIEADRIRTLGEEVGNAACSMDSS
ncbi:hypothetical protein HY490_02570 [Candidatus Woesearchaeota archaeon]|nr:hypothetical protein [Candidatus Woesearchaeota archaeon]